MQPTPGPGRTTCPRTLASAGNLELSGGTQCFHFPLGSTLWVSGVPPQKQTHYNSCRKRMSTRINKCPFLPVSSERFRHQTRSDQIRFCSQMSFKELCGSGICGLHRCKHCEVGMYTLNGSEQVPTCRAPVGHGLTPAKRGGRWGPRWGPGQQALRAEDAPGFALLVEDPLRKKAKSFSAWIRILFPITFELPK